MTTSGEYIKHKTIFLSFFFGIKNDLCRWSEWRKMKFSWVCNMIGDDELKKWLEVLQGEIWMDIVKVIRLEEYWARELSCERNRGANDEKIWMVISKVNVNVGCVVNFR